MKKKKLVGIIILLILIALIVGWYFTKDYGQRTGVVTGWNNIQLGFNIFFEEGDTLFLHGDDYRRNAEENEHRTSNVQHRIMNCRQETR